jgi:hypothetical protein
MEGANEGKVLVGEGGVDLRRAVVTAGARTTVLFRHSWVLRGEQATETNVRTVERPLILHMASHGFFGEARNERDKPMFRSGLYLADVELVEVVRR